MIELKKESESVLLIGVGLPGQDDVEDSLKELSELAATAGAQTVGQVIQSRDQIHPGTYVGKGKIDEIKDLLWELDATGIICDDAGDSEPGPDSPGNLCRKRENR